MASPPISKNFASCIREILSCICAIAYTRIREGSIVSGFAARFPQINLTTHPMAKREIGTKTGGPRRVAISLELDWGFKHHLEIYAGCQRYADEVGWESSINPAIDRVLKAGPGPTPYDGVLARVTAPLAESALKAGIPVVNLWANSPVRGLPGVHSDAGATGEMAAKHLLARGFKNFAYLGFQREIDSRMALRAFRHTVRREGFRCTSFRGVRSSTEGKARGWRKFVADLDAWIGTWMLPIGVYVNQDLFCRYLIDVCRANGLLVPQDVAIVGRGNEPAICDSPQPTLTSIDPGYGLIGYRAAALLDHLMDGNAPPPTPLLVPPAELVPRQSTDSYAVEDPIVVDALRFIAENGHVRIQVNDVAAAVASTRRTLERRFRISVGHPIADVITRMRLERAKRRMVETDAPLKDVASEAGFRDADHFYKVFARVEGMSPTAYRDSHQQAFPLRIG